MKRAGLLLLSLLWLGTTTPPRTAAAAGKSSRAAKSSSKKPAAKKKNTKNKKSKKPPAPKKPPPFPCSALPWEPVLLTSEVARHGETALVTQDFLVVGRTPDKSGAKTEDGRLFVSFGSPGLPLSMRIEFAPLHDGELAFPGHVADRTRSLVYMQAPESDGACTLLGRSNESGVVVQIPRDLAVDPATQLAVLRVEQSVQLGTLEEGARDLVLRLSSFGGKPVRLGPVQSKERLSLELCAHGQPSVPLSGSLLVQIPRPEHDLCVTLGKPNPSR